MRPLQLTRARCTVTALAGDADVRVVIDASDAPAPNASTAARWVSLCSANPRLFNGPILSVVSSDFAEVQTRDRADDPKSAHAVVVRARHDQYQRLAVQPWVDNGVDLLAVRGIVTANDGGGARHVLVGARNRQTHVYGGLWEFGPSGGLHPPERGVRELHLKELVTLLGRELNEEAGLGIDRAECRPAAICHDSAAHGFDIVLHVKLRDRVEDVVAACNDWEYDAVRWVRVSGFADWAGQVALSPPTEALAVLFAWM